MTLLLTMVGTSVGQSGKGEAIASVKKSIDEAAKLYKAKKMEDASDQINAANKQLANLLDHKLEEADFEKIKQIYPRLKKAHELISKEVISIDKLVELPSKAPDEGSSSAFGESEKVSHSEKAAPTEKAPKGSKKTKVSFTKQIAPILVQNCGNCHIRGQQGQVSLATFETLIDSPKGLIAANEPRQSRLFQSIESNKMPPRRPLNDKDRKLIKQWIEEGAEFDGKDKEKSDSLNTFGKSR